MSRAKTRSQAGFSFIEILVVMGIISVLVSMVVVVIPMMQERSNQTKSKDNVKNMVTMMLSRRTQKTTGGWPPYSGKNFVLSLVAMGLLDIRNPQNLETLYSPGDQWYTLEKADKDRYKDISKQSLKSGTDFHELTSYAGRRNADREFLITADQEKIGTIIICDDDDGPLHHPGGVVAGYTNAAVRFMTWEDLDMLPPEDADEPDEFLGDAASNEMLMAMYGQP